MALYIILGLERSATLSDVRRAYRRLARKYHPGINPGDRNSASVFSRVTEAYQVLSAPEQRRRYDSRGSLTDTLPESSFEFQGFDFSGSAEGEAASTFGDLFADVLRTDNRADGVAADGTDLHLSIRISFNESMRGTERAVTVARLNRCDDCRGSGALRMVEGRCAACRGTGRVRWVRGHMVFSRACVHCGGSGRQEHRACLRCEGSGAVQGSESVRVRIPAGVDDGGRVRVPKRGHVGRRGGRPGDLYLTVEVEPHPLFTREGNDLHLVLPVAVHEAALGAKIEVPTLDGRGNIRIPPGTQSGQRFRLRGRGVPDFRGRDHAGDLVVEVQLVLKRYLPLCLKSGIR